jgi:membrane-bound inhibitor of C-type lysozyme
VSARLTILSCAAIMPLAACSAGSADKLTTRRYQCGDLAVSAEFHGEKRVLLSLPGNKLLLEPVPAASGAKYADSKGNEFWTRDGALLTVAGQPLRRCTPVS